MSNVEAMFKYSYEYEGKTISFLKGETFSLIKKVNTDWWQVKRRHDNGASESIYVPANYMKEVENTTAQSHTYQNMSDLQSEYIKTKKGLEKRNSLKDHGNGPPRVSPKLTRIKSIDKSGDKSNGSVTKKPDNVSRSESEPTQATPNLPIVSSANQIKLRSQTVTGSEMESSLDAGGKRSTLPKTTSTNSGNTQRNQFQSLLNTQLSGGRLVGSTPASTQPKPQPRPQSYYVDEEMPTTPSTFVTSPTPLGAGTSTKANLPALDFGKRSFKKKDNADSAKVQSSPTTPTQPSQLPEGWSEHKTEDGKVYYYNCITKESKWTRPIGAPIIPLPPPPEDSPKHQSSVGMPSGSGISPSSSSPKKQVSDSLIDRIAPRGWTKEINSITQTPIFTNSKTMEKWAVAKDDRGYHYYLMSNPSIKLQDLPAILDDTSEALYDHLLSVTTPNVRSRISSDNTYDEPEFKTQPKPLSANSVQKGMNPSQQLDIWSTCMSTTFLRKHGYLLRKKIIDSNGKKLRNEKWIRLFVSLQSSQLLFYTDHRVRDQPNSKPLSTFSLLHCSICLVNYKDKKKNVIQISSSMGEQFYLEAENPQMMNDWYSTIQTVIDQTNEDYKKNPDKYSNIISSQDASDFSPPLQSKFGHRKSSAMLRDFDDIEEIEQLSGAEKTVRIKGRLRNLIARRPQMDTLKKTGIMQEPTFGCPLEALTAREHRHVPIFLENLISHIEAKGLTVIGLYRLSGNASQVQKLRYSLEENPRINLTHSEWADVNVVTGCLKLYFRELPNPLVPFKNYRALLNTASLPLDKKVVAIANEVSKFPESHYRTMKFLIKHLVKVVEHSHVNKMLANNLGIVFGPTLMRCEVDSLEIATLMPLQNNIIETVIKEEASIFRK